MVTGVKRSSEDRIPPTPEPGFARREAHNENGRTDDLHNELPAYYTRRPPPTAARRGPTGEPGVPPVKASEAKRYFANSTLRDSRITVTLIWPGYSRSFSISRAISCESSA